MIVTLFFHFWKWFLKYYQNPFKSNLKTRARRDINEYADYYADIYGDTTVDEPEEQEISLPRFPSETVEEEDAESVRIVGGKYQT